MVFSLEIPPGLSARAATDLNNQTVSTTFDFFIQWTYVEDKENQLITLIVTTLTIVTIHLEF